jgi:hypothetical protein
MWLSLRLRSIKGIGLRWLKICISSDVLEDFDFLWFCIERIFDYISWKIMANFFDKYSKTKLYYNIYA